MDATTFQEFGFAALCKCSDHDLLMMNRPSDFKDLNENELEKYNLETVAYKGWGMGCYSVIGKRMTDRDVQTPIYYFLQLGGSSGYSSLDNHIIAQHYCHHDVCGQTFEELVDFLREDKKKNRIQKCWGFPLFDKMAFKKLLDFLMIQEFFNEPENKDKCYLCSGCN